MATSTQPVLCCLGSDVSEEPTQFVMERLFLANGLDWKAITVELNRASLSTALAGAQAMQFQALRFFDQLRSSAAEILFADDPRWELVGGITSGHWSEEGWEGWHHAGHAILDWVADRHSSGRILMAGEGEMVCSCALALLERAVPDVYWLDPPPAAQQLLKDLGDQEANWHATTLQSVETDLQGDAPLVYVGSDEGLNLGQDWEQPPQWQGFVSDKEERPETGLDPDLILVPTERLIWEEAYDFRRWTGREGDLEAIREAHEEFRAF